MTYRIGSLCSGYEGIGAAVAPLIGGELAWVADNDPAAAKLLACRFPGIRNLGDISLADWSQVEPVDVLCAGFPCTDLSQAGQRAGLLHGNRSGVWHHVATAIAELRPSLVLIENVRGLLTARGDEPTPEHLRAEAARDACARLIIWLDNERDIAMSKGRRERARECSARIARVMGLRKRAVARCQWHERRLVRAIGTVLGSLAGLGFDAEWTMLAASEVGAPHRRERIFIIAWPAADARRVEPERRGDAGVLAGPERAAARARDQRERDGDAPVDRHPAAADAQGAGPRGGSGTGTPGPAGSGGAAQDPDGAAREQRREPAPGQAEGGRSRADSGGPGRALAADADRDGLPRGEERDEWPQFAEALGEQRRVDPLGRVLDWGIYEAAIRRWEAVTGRPAPAPTHPGRGGVPRLSPLLPEWMMGLPEGWVTDVPGLSGNDMLRLLGNGVVVQQAAAAYSLLLAAWLEAVEAA
jgi:DNA (cytosine-5)-methyltransferase 1